MKGKSFSLIVLRAMVYAAVMAVVIVFAFVMTEKAFAAESISGASVKLEHTSYTYDNTAKEPDVTVTLNGSTLYRYWDYNVKYQNNKKAGVAKVIITGEDEYTGTITKKFRIKKRKLSKRWFQLSGDNFVFNGKTKKLNGRYTFPTTYASKFMKRGRDVTIKPGKIKKIGKYKVIVRGKGNFTGKLKYNVYVRPKNPKGVKLVKRYKKSFRIKWAARKGVSGYIVEYYTDTSKRVRKNLGKKRAITVPVDSDYGQSLYVYSYKKVKGKKILSKGRYYFNGVKPKGRPKFSTTGGYSQITFKMKKDGYYEIWVATNKSFTQDFYMFTPYILKGSDYSLTCYGENFRFIKIRQYVPTPSGKKLYGKFSKRRRVNFY